MNSIIISKIIERDRVFGKFCSEAEESYIQKNYFSALACLFVVSEQIIKHAIGKIDGNFYQAISEAKEKKLINGSEFLAINYLRELRNKILFLN